MPFNTREKGHSIEIQETKDIDEASEASDTSDTGDTKISGSCNESDKTDEADDAIGKGMDETSGRTETIRTSEADETRRDR